METYILQVSIFPFYLRNKHLRSKPVSPQRYFRYFHRLGDVFRHNQIVRINGKLGICPRNEPRHCFSLGIGNLV